MLQDRLAFTKARLDAVTCPLGKDRVYVYDRASPGLALCRTATGRASFYLYKRVAGRPQRTRLGGWPELTIDQARKLAAEMLGEIARGLDPQAQRRKGRAEPTLADLFTHYLERHAKPHKNTWEEDQRRFDYHLAAWRSRRLSTIDRPAVQSLHTRVGRDSGHYAANRLLAMLSKVYSMAADLGHAGPNPCKGVRRFKEKGRERFLQADELPRFFAALDEEPNATVRDYIYLSLLTGARRGNVQAMRWADVRFERASWTIPDTKGGHPVTVPLVGQASAILLARHQERTSDEWVFPGWGRRGHLVEPRRAWGNILRRAGIADVRLHDLRRTLGSWQAAAGASLTIIGKSLGHRGTAATQIYARLNLDPVRQSVGTATDAILAARLAKPKGGA